MYNSQRRVIKFKKGIKKHLSDNDIRFFCEADIMIMKEYDKLFLQIYGEVDKYVAEGRMLEFEDQDSKEDFVHEQAYITVDSCRYRGRRPKVLITEDKQELMWTHAAQCKKCSERLARKGIHI